MFTEDVIEKMIIDSLVKNGWEYIPAEELPRNYTDVMVEPMVRDALIRLNPEIAATPSYADEVIIKLRPLFMQAKATDLVTLNEEFKNQIFEKNAFPFGENHSFIPVTYFGMGSKEEMAKNRYVVTNQWVYPQVEGGKRLDIVLLINGFPVVIGEIKTATREAISWIDGAEDILDYEKSIPGMFVSNIFNFATEGKRFRYGAVNSGVTHWGPWHVPECKDEGTLADVHRSITAMIQHETVLDIFRYFTIFSTDKKFRKFKVVCRYQQYEGANLLVERVIDGKPKKGLIWHFQGRQKGLISCSPVTPSVAVAFLERGATVLVTTDISAPVSIVKSIIWSPTFSSTMGLWGPCVFEPQQPHSVSSPASPITADAKSFSSLFWGHSFSQWLKPRHQAHWFGCRVALGLLVGGLPRDQLQPRGNFGEDPGKGLPKASAGNGIL